MGRHGAKVVAGSRGALSSAQRLKWARDSWGEGGVADLQHVGVVVAARRGVRLQPDLLIEDPGHAVPSRADVAGGAPELRRRSAPKVGTVVLAPVAQAVDDRAAGCLQLRRPSRLVPL